MAVTRIKNNQITDSTITGSKLVNKTITSGLLEDNLTYGSDLTVSGNLIVSGTTTTVDTTNTLIADPLFVLSRGETGTPSVDSGIVIERGTSTNVAFIWDESADRFVAALTTEDGNTAGDILISSYADLTVADILASSGSIANIDISGNTISSSNLNGDISIVPDGSGAINLSSDSVVVGDLNTNATITTNGTGDLVLSTNGGTDSGTITIADGANGDISITPNGTGAVVIPTLEITGLTTDRVLLAGVDGAISDNANLTFDGSTLTVTGNVLIDSVSIDGNTITTTAGNLALTSTGGEVVASSMTVSDLTSGRVTLAGASGALEDSANLTFNGTTLTVTGTTNVSVDLNVSGEATLASATVSDLTSGRVVLAGTAGAIEDSANMTFDGTTLTVTGAVEVDNVSIDGNDITSTNLNGNVNITPNGTGEVVMSTATVSDLTDNRIVLAGANGALEDDANLTFDGSVLAATASVDITGDLDVDNINIDGNAITSTDLDGDITITPNGAGEVVMSTATVSDLTSGRVVLAGASGSIEDSANLTFDGSTLDVTGAADVSGNATVGGTLGVTGQSTLASAAVSDLTSGRVVLAGLNGELEDSANFTFDGSVLNVTGSATVDNVSIDGNTVSTTAGNLSLTSTGGEVTASSMAVSDLTSGRITFAGTGGALQDSANLTFDGSTLDVTGAADVSGNATVGGTLGVTGEATLASATVSDLTDNRIVVAGTAGALEDDANLTWDGLDMNVVGGVNVTGDLAVDNVTVNGNTVSTSAGNLALNSTGGEVTAPSMTVSDLTDNRIVVAGASGSLEDDANLTWDGAAMGVTGGIDITGDLDIDNINIDGNDITSTNANGNINITPDGTGVTNIKNLNLDGMDPTSVIVTDANGTLVTDANITWDGSSLDVTGAVTIDNITVDGDTISSVHSTITIDPSTAGAGGTVIIEGNLQVTGTTTTVESTVVTIADPLFQLGESTNDGLDRGITALYNDGAADKTAFFGFDDSANEFVFIPDATDAGSVISGSLGSAAFGSLRVTDLTDNRLLIAGASGEVEDSANLTFDGTTFAVVGVAEFDNVQIDGNEISTTAGNLSLDATGGEVIASSMAVSDLTSGRVVLAGASGAIEDSANLTFNGTTLTVTGAASVSGNATVGGTLGVTGQSTLASAAVSDLTDGRVVLAGTAGELEDSANFTFDGTTLTVTGAAAIDNVSIDGNTVTTSAGNLALTSTGGEVTASSMAVSDLTSGRVTYAGANGALVDNANMTFDGTDLTVASAKVSDLTSGRVVLAGVDGAVEDSANLTFDGTLLTVTGAAAIDNIKVDGNAITSTDLDGDITITPNGAGEVVMSTATISDVTATHVMFAGTDGSVEGSADLTWDGSTLDVTGAASVSGNATVGGTLGVTGEATLASATISDVTATHVMFAGTAGAVEGSANLTWDGTSFDVVGAVNVDNINIDGNAITSTDANGNISLTPNGTGEVVMSTATVSDLTSGRVVLAGVSGALEDSGNLTFNGTTLTVTGAASVSGNATVGGTLGVTGQSTLASAAVSDLTSGRVVLAGTAGELEDSANMTFDGTTLTIVGAGAFDNVTLDGNTVSTSAGNLALTSTGGEVVASSMAVSDLTSGRVVLAGTAGAVEDSANLTFNGTTLTVTGALAVDNINIDGNAITSTDANGNVNITPNGTGEVVASTLSVSDLTNQRVVLAGASGAIEDSANLTFDGTTLTVTGSAVVDNVTVDGNNISSVSNLSFDAVANGEIAFNESGNNVDFRIESDTDSTALFLDGSTGNLGLKTGTPNTGAALHINSTDSMIIPTGTQIQRPASAVTGMTRLNTTIGKMEFYDGTEWITAGSDFTIFTADSFSGDDTTTAFTLSEDATSAGVLVAINGIVQDPGTAYSVSGTTLTFTEAPATGDNIDVRILTTTSTITDLADGDTYVSVDDAAQKIAFSVNGTEIAYWDSTGLIPTANITYDLGSSTMMWKDIYVGPGSLYVNGQKVLHDDSGNIVVSADADQNLVIQTSGSGDIELNPTGAGIIQLKGTVQIEAGSNITTSDGNPLSFGNSLKANALSSADADTNLTLSGNGTGIVQISDDLTVTGNLTVGGTTTTVNSTTLTVADLNITVAQGAANGTAANGAGLTVDGAGATFTYNAAGDKWVMNKSLDTDLIGNADTASKWATARTITLGGDLSGSVSIDGSANVTLNAVIADDSHNHTIANIDGLQAALDAKADDVTQFIAGAGLTDGGTLGADRTFNVGAGSYIVVAADTVSVDATSANTASKVVARDASGNFSAGTITAALTGNVTGNVTGDVTGNAGTATKLATARTIALSGDVSGSASFDGSANVTITATIADDSHNHTIANVDGLQTALDAKADDATTFTAGAGLTGGGTLGANRTFNVGAGAGITVNADNVAVDTTTIATRSYVDTSVANLVDTAPAALDTLNELAAALGDDPNFATTVSTQIGTKLDATANAVSASKWATARTITLSGDASGSVSIDGSENVTLSVTVADDSHNHTIANIDGLQTALDGKLTAGATSGNGISGSASSGTFTVTSNATSANTANTIVFRDASGNFSAGTITATSTSAQYADLAENYTADAQYEPGTVVSFGGNAEVTVNGVDMDRRVAGVVSTDPAHLMNADCEGEFVVALALQGRVPCKVIGPVQKGDLMVAAGNGYARAELDPKVGTIIGKSLEDHDGGMGVIEVAVGRF